VKPLTQIFYINTVENLLKPFRRARPDRNFAEILLQHDNSRPNPPKTREIITKLEWGVIAIPRPPYSPDLASCDFHFFETLSADSRCVAGQAEFESKECHPQMKSRVISIIQCDN
jgi:hypothetical protein